MLHPRKIRFSDRCIRFLFIFEAFVTPSFCFPAWIEKFCAAPIVYFLFSWKYNSFVFPFCLSLNLWFQFFFHCSVYCSFTRHFAAGFFFFAQLSATLFYYAHTANGHTLLNRNFLHALTVYSVREIYYWPYVPASIRAE